MNKNDKLRYEITKACKDRDIKYITLLLDKGANVNTIASDHNIPLLMLSYRMGHKDIVNILLERNANPNLILIDACINEEKNLVELLIEKSANIHVQDVYGMTPLMYSCKFGNKDIVQLLLGKQVNIHAKDIHGVNTLMYAIKGNNKEIIELLLVQGASLNETDNKGTTILMFAAETGNKEIVKLLIEKGLDVNAKDKYGVTALMIASGCGYKDIVELLIENKAEISNDYIKVLEKRIDDKIGYFSPCKDRFYDHKFPSCLVASKLCGWEIDSCYSPEIEDLINWHTKSIINWGKGKFIKGNIDPYLLVWLNFIIIPYLETTLDVQWIARSEFKGDLFTFVANLNYDSFGIQRPYLDDQELNQIHKDKEIGMLCVLDPQKDYIYKNYYKHERPIDVFKMFVCEAMEISLNGTCYEKSWKLDIDLWLEPGFDSTKAIEQLYGEIAFISPHSELYHGVPRELYGVPFEGKNMKKLGKILNRIGDFGTALLPGGFDPIRERLIYANNNSHYDRFFISTDSYLYVIGH